MNQRNDKSMSPSRQRALVTNLLGVLILAASGCAANPTEERFGVAVRETLAAQSVVPADQPSTHPAVVQGADASMVHAAVEAMRTDVATRKEVKQGVTINVGEDGAK